MARLVQALLSVDDQSATHSESSQRCGHQWTKLGPRDTDQLMRCSCRLVNGPRMLNTVRIPIPGESERRIALMDEMTAQRGIRIRLYESGWQPGQAGVRSDLPALPTRRRCQRWTTSLDCRAWRQARRIPASTKAAAVEELNVCLPDPPVPAVSARRGRSDRSTRRACSRIARASPTTSSTDSPFIRSPVSSAAAWIRSASPDIRASIAPDASASDRLRPSSITAASAAPRSVLGTVVGLGLVEEVLQNGVARLGPD